nr:hypothetical protein [Tanacetum cinerariifolium]
MIIAYVSFIGHDFSERLRFCLDIYGAFRSSAVYSLTFPFPSYYMSSRPQTASENVIPKFDMHVYTFILTLDTKDRFFLINCRAISDAMPWRHQDSSVVDPPPTGVQDEDICRLCDQTDHQRVVEYENEMVLAAKQKAQASKDRAAGKRSAAEGTSRIHHSASPLNIIIPDDANPATGGCGVASESVGYEEDDADHGLENTKEGTEADSHPATRYSGSCSEFLFWWFGSSGLPKRNPKGDGVGSSLRAEAAQRSLFALQCSWFELGRRVLAQIELLQWYEALSDDYGDLTTLIAPNKLADDHKYLQQEHLGCAGYEAGLFDKIAAVEKEKDDLFDKKREQEDELKGDLERLTVDLSQAKIVRHNYVWKLLPTTFRRLLSSNKYNKSLSDVFNQAIDAGWSEGVKLSICGEAYEVLPSALGRPSEHVAERKRASLGHWHLDSSGASCAPGNMHHLAIGTWTHPERLVLWEMYVTWPLALGLIQIVLHSRKWRYLAIDTWTHRKRLALWEMCVTWPLALGLIRRSIFRRNSSSFSSSLIIMVREVRWAQSMLGSSLTHPALSLPSRALIPSIRILFALSTRPFVCGFCHYGPCSDVHSTRPHMDFYDNVVSLPHTFSQTTYDRGHLVVLLLFYDIVYLFSVFDHVGATCHVAFVDLTRHQLRVNLHVFVLDLHHSCRAEPHKQRFVFCLAIPAGEVPPESVRKFYTARTDKN